jgi:hypothetical protein
VDTQSADDDEDVPRSYFALNSAPRGKASSKSLADVDLADDGVSRN